MFRTMFKSTARVFHRTYIKGGRTFCSNPIPGCSKLHESLLNLKADNEKRLQMQPCSGIHEDSSQMLSQHFFSNLSALKINCEEMNTTRSPIKDFIAHVKSEIEIKRPEIVILSDLQERHFLHVVKKAMRDLGYDSNFGKLKDGKGEANFVRHDVVKEKGRDRNLRYFRSRKPDPC